MSIQMQKTQRFTGTEPKEYLPLFIKFLQVGLQPITFGHVIFRCGTAVRLDIEIEPFTGFDDEYTDDYPTHRVSEKTFTKIMKENIHDWNWSQTTPFAKEIAKAYAVLVDDGYPFPGGEGGDRITLPSSVDCQLTMVLFHHRRNAGAIFTLSYLKEPIKYLISKKSELANLEKHMKFLALHQPIMPVTSFSTSPGMVIRQVFGLSPISGEKEDGLQSIPEEEKNEEEEKKEEEKNDEKKEKKEDYFVALPEEKERDEEVSFDDLSIQQLELVQDMVNQIYDSHQRIGAEHRRFDFMQPQAYAIIDSQLNIHYL